MAAGTTRRAVAAALIVLAGWLAAAPAGATSPAREGSLVDQVDAVSEADEARLEAALARLRGSTSVDVGVLLVTGTIEPDEAVAERLFRDWQVGAPDGEGVAIVIATVDRRARVHVGEAVRGRLTPDEAEGLLDDGVLERFADDDVAGGVALLAQGISDEVGGGDLGLAELTEESLLGGYLLLGGGGLAVVAAVVGTVRHRRRGGRWRDLGRSWWGGDGDPHTPTHGYASSDSGSSSSSSSDSSGASGSW